MGGVFGHYGRRLTGVFATRSRDRPNPLGLHPVRVRAIDGRRRLRIGPIEAIDGTPVVDIKPTLRLGPGGLQNRGDAPVKDGALGGTRTPTA